MTSVNNLGKCLGENSKSDGMENANNVIFLM